MPKCTTVYTPARIQYLLKERGITQKRIAQEEGVSEMSISDVIHHKLVSNRLMRAVARRIGADHRAVFSWYYDQKRPQRPIRAAEKDLSISL